MWEGLSTRLTGSLVELQPLAPEHEAPLYEAARDPRIWRWLPSDAPQAGDGVAPARAQFSRWFEQALEKADAGLEAPFATVDRQLGAPIGSTRYLALRQEHRGLEIGWTWLSPSAWRTGINAEAKLLMLGHAFERLGCVRVEFKTDARNERSRGALEALPAQLEGIFRQHMVLPNDLRDSAYYSVIDAEWPTVRAHLRERLTLKSPGGES
jgi:RimJ/RimL family protein N-acetyltransferase